MKRVKILALGISQSNFLGQLYGDLQKKFPDYKVAINKFSDISGGSVKFDTEIFEEYFNFDVIPVSRYESFSSFIKLLFTKDFWQLYYFERSQSQRILSIYQFLRSYAYDKVIVQKAILTAGYDIYHFHFCTPSRLKYLYHVPEGKKIICSFWGSDLLRNTGASNVFYVGKAIRKATVITVQNIELAEILYTKYGRDLKDKTTIVQFTINTETYHFIDKFRMDIEQKNQFKISNNIPLDKTVITVSHNGHPEGNHIKILDALEKLPREIKENIILLFPIGYGGTKAYIQQLESYKILCNIKMILLPQFYGPKDIALLRLSTDLMIQMPVSDALSGAMTEVLYAGNHVIAGAWLPYGIIRRNGVYFTEIEDFIYLPAAIKNYIKNAAKMDDDENNSEKIKNFLFPSTTTVAWNHIFQNI